MNHTNQHRPLAIELLQGSGRFDIWHAGDNNITQIFVYSYATEMWQIYNVFRKSKYGSLSTDTHLHEYFTGSKSFCETRLVEASCPLPQSDKTH